MDISPEGSPKPVVDCTNNSTSKNVDERVSVRSKHPDKQSEVPQSSGPDQSMIWGKGKV